MGRYHRLLSKSCGRRTIGFLLVFVFSIFFTSAAHASIITVDILDNITIDVARPNQLASDTGSFTVTTDDASGYIAKFSTSGTSTDLISTSDGKTAIPTVILPSGKSSIIASEIENGYAYSIDGANFKPAPSIAGSGDIIATIDRTEPNVADTHEITIGVKVGAEIPPSEYYKTYIITVTANISKDSNEKVIYYDENIDTKRGSIKKSNTSITQTIEKGKEGVLLAPNFSREGYGFAGWNTKADGSGIDYGPNQTINADDIPGDVIVLYAKWLPSTDTLQTWDRCDALTMGSSIALTDSRDGSVYTVAKLADHACWMTENLRLDLSSSELKITEENTNNPTKDFIAAIEKHPSSSSNFCTSNTSACNNQVKFNSGDFFYAYGVYYNWYTATAGHGIYSISDSRTRVEGDICPKGWSLPTGYSVNGDFALLDIALGGSGENKYSTAMSNAWRSYPNNFVYSGQQKGNTIVNRSETGNYHGASPSSINNSINLWLQSNRVNVNTNGASKFHGQTIRCIKQKYYKIHFDSNTKASVNGKMYDQSVAMNNKIKLDTNTFSIPSDDTYTYKFVGWNTKADGGGDSYKNSDIVTNLASDGEIITLYAQWDITKKVKVTVTFPETVYSIDLKNDEYGDYHITKSGEAVTLYGDKPYKIMVDFATDYDFDSWVVAKGGKVSSKNTSPTTYTASDDTTLSVSVSYRGTPLNLQNINPAVCSATPKIAYDTRDGEVYTIKRLEDGNCWLLEDLKLGKSTLIEPLSSENTNMPEKTTLTFERPNVISKYIVPEIDPRNSGNNVTNYGPGMGTAGVYYNFCAASAGTICSPSTPNNAEYDICPAGWRLPIGGPDGEIAQLYISYGKKIASFNAAFSTTFSGWYDANAKSFKDYDSGVAIWSSTASNSINKTYPARITQSSINYTTGYLENNGLNIRCLLK